MFGFLSSHFKSNAQFVMQIEKYLFAIEYPFWMYGRIHLMSFDSKTSTDSAWSEGRRHVEALPWTLTRPQACDLLVD